MTPEAPAQNIVRQGTPSRSALAVATLRAVHALLDEPLVLDDPVALPLLGREAAGRLRDDPFQYNEPMHRALRACLVTRSRFAEEELARAVGEGVRQYVLLGAGLDTFAYRNPHASSGLQVFEVDHPSTQAWKLSLLDQAGVAASEGVHYVAVDFEKDSLDEALSAAGFRSDQPACFSWMGVSMYLTTEAVTSTLGWVASGAAGNRICFDYNVPVSQLNPIEQLIAKAAQDRVAEMGEPWLSWFDTGELIGLLHRQGFRQTDGLSPDEINARWLARRKDGLRTGGPFRLMCARK